MRSANTKDIFRQIRCCPRRFIAILSIVALGVAFFAGVRASSPDMRLTLDRYYDDQNASDIRLLSTMGFSGEDIDALEEEFDIVQPGYMLDAFAEISGKERLLHLTSYDLDAGSSLLNQPALTEGRLPSAEDECVADQILIDSFGLRVGDTITLRSDDSDVTDNLSRYSFTVVGAARSVQYISVDRGTSTKGSGSVNGFLLVPKSNFTSSVYTEVYLQIPNPDGDSRFSDEYGDRMGEVSARLEEIGRERAPLRLESVQAEAQADLEEARARMTDTEKQLSDAEARLKDGRAQLEEGREELSARRAEYAAGIAEAQRRLSESAAQLESAQKEIEANEAALKEGQVKLEEGRNELEDARLQIATGKIHLDTLGSQLEAARQLLELLPSDSELYEQAAAALNKLESSWAEQSAVLAKAQEQYKAGLNELSRSEQELFSGAVALETAKNQFAAGKAEYEQGLADFEAQKQEGEAQLAEAQRTLAEKEQELADGEAQLESARAQAEPQLADARRQIAAGEDTLKELEEPQWHVLDLSQNQGFESYRQDTERIANIGLVFPIIFFLVAALVSLTTMTRMVDDDRVQIGTRKALGYGRMAIAAKYLVYAALASVGGIVFGLALGLQLFPRVIASAYGILYDLPDVLTPLNVPNSLVAAIGALVCSILPAFLVCQGALMSTPASLMRPRAPKEGKRILLERVKPLWNHMNFSMKVTCRNIFRYKKRLFMTIIGIAGCTALVFTGFGLRSSVNSLVPLQYEQIQKYDMQAGLKDDSGETRRLVDDALEKSGSTEACMYFHSESVTAEAGGTAKDATLVVATDPDAFSDFITLRRRVGKRPVELNSEGVILTEKLGKQLGLGAGDTVTLRDSDGKTFTAPVLASVENYVFNYIYLTSGLYEETFGKEPAVNSLFARLSDTGEAAEESLSTALMDTGRVSYVTFNTQIRENFANMTRALDTVVIVLILSAAALAFVVLFSLTNINIDERMRELATIKVLGFYDRETAMYIYRENIILTILGTLLGLVLGVFLLMYVIITAEVDMAMFSRTVEWWNYLIAAGFTFFFSFLVNLFMSRVIKKIDMVESLKSIE